MPQKAVVDTTACRSYRVSADLEKTRTRNYRQRNTIVYLMDIRKEAHIQVQSGHMLRTDLPQLIPRPRTYSANEWRSSQQRLGIVVFQKVQFSMKDHKAHKN